MSDSSTFITMMWRVLGMLPIIVACVIGIMVLNAKPLPKKVQAAGVTGMVLVALGPVIGLLYSLFMQGFLASGSNAGSTVFSLLQAGYILLAQAIHIAALYFFMVAICHRENAADEKSETSNPY